MSDIPGKKLSAARLRAANVGKCPHGPGNLWSKRVRHFFAMAFPDQLNIGKWKPNRKRKEGGGA